MPSTSISGHGMNDISSRPPLNGIIPVDTNPNSTTSSSADNNNAAPATNGSCSIAAPNDVAGVLRRNQACLACRRRKLKCDAIRPHCSTCVRSYRHLLRTAPSTNPVLSCEYDDSNDKDQQGESGSAEAEDEDEGKKKKRKTSGGGRRKQRDSDMDEEREALMKRVAALEQELANKSAAVSTAPPPPPGNGPPPNIWTDGYMAQQAASPNTFLDMLSSAASAQNNLVHPLWTSGDRSESITGTPFMPVPEPTTLGNFGMTEPSPGATMLYPNSIFNFSPAPSGPAATLQWSGPDVDMEQPPNENWAGHPLRSTPLAAGLGPTPQAAANRKSTEFDSAYVDGIDTTGLDPVMLQQLFWPGWPPNLPEPAQLLRLVETFFEIVPNVPRIIHRGRFLARLQLPPTHSDFPHPGLLHSICSLAASWGVTGEDAPTPPEDHEAHRRRSVSMSQQQAEFAKEAIQEGLNTGNRLMDVVRAMIILTRVFIDDTRMLECWTYCGLVSRMILPLGLNVRSAELSLKSVMLPPPADALEREERRIVVWMSMYHDTISSAASGWGSSTSLDELTVPLPASKVDFDTGGTEIESNPQDLESLDLFIKHPVVDSFVMALKAAVLLYRVNKFVRKWKNRRLRDSDDLDGMQKPEFRELANAIACLQMTYPTELKDFAAQMDESKRLDVDLISSHLIPHTAVISLYEMFADVTDPKDVPAKKIIHAARSIIRVIQHVIAVLPNGDNNLAAVMHSSSSVALVTAARTCLLFYRHALNIGDTMGAEGYKADIETARLGLAQYGSKFRIGFHHAQLIEYFLDRASNPTYEKLAAHFPEHPRAGALPLTPDSHFGVAILTALNIKRGYWKATPETHSSLRSQAMISGEMSNGSTPGSQGSGRQGGRNSIDSNSSTGPSTSVGQKPAPHFVGSAWNRADEPQRDSAMDLTHFSAVKFLDFGSGRPKQDTAAISLTS